jgi:hypothetical protein
MVSIVAMNTPRQIAALILDQDFTAARTRAAIEPECGT